MVALNHEVSRPFARMRGRGVLNWRLHLVLAANFALWAALLSAAARYVQ